MPTNGGLEVAPTLQANSNWIGNSNVNLIRNTYTYIQSADKMMATTNICQHSHSNNNNKKLNNILLTNDKS